MAHRRGPYGALAGCLGEKVEGTDKPRPCSSSSKLDPISGLTDAKGQFKVKVYGWHVCGDDARAASDRVVLSYDGKQAVQVVSCGMRLVRLPDQIGSDMQVSGNITGRYVQQTVL